jgi:plasmid stabilization system protein ParE
MAAVIWSMQARDDLNDIYAYLEPFSRKVAIEVTQTISQKTRLLSTFPQIGRVVPGSEDETVRELIWKKYRIVYELLDADVVVVQKIVHSSRNPEDF